MKKLQTTLKEIQNVLGKSHVTWLLTRYNKYIVPNDLDILVHPKDFKNTAESLERAGYSLLSHDQALGGRIRGMQINCVKKGRMKIDLHQNFTWRKTEYLDQKILWNSHKQTIESVNVQVPPAHVDAFLIFINILFEKTYMSAGDMRLIQEYLSEIESGVILKDQTKHFGWYKSYVFFTRWLSKVDKTTAGCIFLPMWLIIFSYIEKGIHDKRTDFISLVYYVFFRTRALVAGVLPYE